MLSLTDYEEVLQMRREFAALRADLERTVRDYYARKAGFRQDQPRWPKRSGVDSGRWSGGAGTGSSDAGQTTDFSAIRRKPRLPGLTVPHMPPVTAPTYTPGRVTIINNAQTGISTVDENTEKLKTVLEKVVNGRPEGFGRAYGQTIHYDFGNAVKAENLRGIGSEGVEHTFPEQGTRYGSKGTVRTDIILRNDIGDVIAIYDVKTGTAELDARRVQELRVKTDAGLHIPIIEMHIQRGLSLKAQTVHGRYFWIITLRLWNPWIRGIAGQGAGENVASMLR